MKKFILLLILFITSNSYSQTITENWFKINLKKNNGYLHYIIQEDSLSIKTTLEIKFKVNPRLFYVKAKLNSNKDLYLTLNSFVINIGEDLKKSTISGRIKSNEKSLKWKIVRERDKEIIQGYEIITEKPTIVDWNLFYVLTKLDYSKKGVILKYNSMEISETNYKKNHYLTYLDDEIIQIGDKKILTKKITHNGEGILGSTFWLDSKNKLVKIAIDNKKIGIRCKKEDINFEDYN